MTEVRVRQTIQYVVDDTESAKPSPFPAKVFTTRYPTVKYPYSVVKEKAYSYFGLDLETLVATSLSKAYGKKFVGTDNIGTPDFSYLSTKDREQYTSVIDQYVTAVTDYFLYWYPPAKITKIVYQHEFRYLDPSTKILLTGHPDLIIHLPGSEVVIYDVKVFARTTNAINKEMRIQILTYAAMARLGGFQCNTVGVVTPWARDPAVVDFDVSKWDHHKLLVYVLPSISKVIYAPTHYLKWSVILITHNVGCHVHRYTIENIITTKAKTTKPFQVFLYANNPSLAMETKGRAELAKLNIDFADYTIFVHAPYNITLCSPEEYVVVAAKNYLVDSQKLKARGVVFHTGHWPQCNDDPDAYAAAWECMTRNVNTLLEHVHPGTPLLIETPCCNTNEMLATAESLAEFVSQYPEHLVGICLDTCHVFVGGVMPLDYLQQLGEAHERVALVHFNGSRKKFGCHADGHAHVTAINNIPDEQLEGVLQYASKHNVACVTE